jgi:phage tail-like protein
MAAGPILVEALPLNGTTIRVTWSFTVKAVLATAANDALNPANYAIAALSAPAMPLTVTSVALVYAGTFLIDDQVDLTLDYDQSPDASYQLTATGVVGVIGTFYTDPTAGTPVALFTGYRPPRPIGRRFDLLTMLPERNVADDATNDLHNFIACLQDLLDLALYRIDTFPDIWDYDLCPAAYLDAILYGLGNPFAFVLSDVDKRRLASVLVTIYEQKGTEVGIINALHFFLGVTATVVCVARDDTWEIPLDCLGGTDLTGQTVTVPDHTNDRMSLAVACHFETDDPVEFTTTGVLPAPLVAGTMYYVRDVSGTTFKLSATAGGAVLDITSAGVGVHTVFNRDTGTAMVGPDRGSAWIWGFEVYVDLALTAEERRQALLIIDYMRAVNTRLTRFYEVGVQTWP